MNVPPEKTMKKNCTFSFRGTIHSPQRLFGDIDISQIAMRLSASTQKAHAIVFDKLIKTAEHLCFLRRRQVIPGAQPDLSHGESSSPGLKAAFAT
jgi:hypothetical protein